jgi:primosomal protein N' (replication factor Y) (superfamily II helicase)
MTSRANSMVMPKVEIIDMRNELDEGNRSIFSRRLSEEIEKNIASCEQTMLFLNRRGHSSFVFCRKCGFTLKCLNCNISLTFHSKDERLICHYCGYTIKNPKQCPNCKSDYIRHFGTGTQRVEDDLKKQFPESTVIRMDMDTTTYKNSHEEILRTFKEQNVNVMIGTQMIAKGHDFPNVTLVGVLMADSLLQTGDFRASERTFQLITQVAGRAGRGSLLGRVIIQTYNTEDFSILAASNHDYTGFYNQEIQIRKKLDYLPFTNIAVIILSGRNDKQVFKKSKEVSILAKELFGDYEGQIEILGPARSPLSKLKNKYRWRIIIKCLEIDRLINVLSGVSDSFYRKKDKDEIELSVDINPVNML